MTTFVLPMFDSNLLDAKGTPVVLGLALAYGGSCGRTVLPVFPLGRR